MRGIYPVPEKYQRKNPFYHLYVLKLEDGKYYVGLSRDINKRFAEHKNGEGAKWTKLYHPVKIIYKRQTVFTSYNYAKMEEDKETIKVMRRYGRSNVRGGIYCAVDQDIVDDLLGEQLCREIPLNKKPKTAKKTRKQKLQQGPDSRLKGYKIVEYCLAENTKNTFLRNCFIEHVKIPNGKGFYTVTLFQNPKEKTIYVSDVIMKKFGKQIRRYFETTDNEDAD